MSYDIRKTLYERKVNKIVHIQAILKKNDIEYTERLRKELLKFKTGMLNDLINVLSVLNKIGFNTKEFMEIFYKILNSADLYRTV